MIVQQKLNRFYALLDEIFRLRRVGALLDWDRNVMMPSNGGDFRAEQQELLERLCHRMETAEELREICGELASQAAALGASDAVNVREVKRRIERLAKLPEAFVAEKKRISSQSYAVWIEAKRGNDFQRVLPFLQQLIELSRREAQLIGYTQHPYDPLLDHHEPGARLSAVRPIILGVAEQVQLALPRLPLAQAAAGYPAALCREKQEALCRRAVAALGYDFAAGRLDPTVHPFAQTMGPNDVRISTRYADNWFPAALYSALHEAGHALYELGLPRAERGRPTGSSASVGVHESQSRLWENLIGRSRAFCGFLHKLLGEISPVHQQHTAADLFLLVNRVRPSLIRVEADEVTYSLHVAVRLLLEEHLISGAMNAADIPAAWAELYEQYLGLRPDDHRSGVLQDVHWFIGGFGYFPTYVLGNVYGAMLLGAAQRALPELDAEIARGDFRGLRFWLAENIYRHGMRYGPVELIERAAGEKLSIRPFISYLARKHPALFVQ